MDFLRQLSGRWRASDPTGEPAGASAPAEGHVAFREPAPSADSMDWEIAPQYSTDRDSDGTGGGPPRQVGVDDFHLLKVLGKGAFGKVMLVQKRDAAGRAEGPLLAMKSLRKQMVFERNQITHTATERAIVQHVQHPFLVKLVYAFQTAEKLYMVLEYMPGGELLYWLRLQRRFSEDRSRLYGAEIGLGLAALHERGLVYRDLKPENVMLDAEGHVRITDFGLAKDGVTSPDASGGTKTFCGTPEYLAPELLQDTGHGFAVDWWSFGTLLFEMMCGVPPFYDHNVRVMYEKILSAPLRFPPHLSKVRASVWGSRASTSPRF